MKIRVNKILHYIFVFIILMLLFNVSLYVACLIDSKLLQQKVEESSVILKKEGLFFKVSKVFNVINDNATDAAMINESFSIDNRNPYRSYMKSRRNYNRNYILFELPETVGEGVAVNYVESDNNESFLYYNTIDELEDFLSGKIQYTVNYGRYWHGYLIFLRPLLIIFNISQIRVLLLIMYVFLFLIFNYLVNKEFNKQIAIIFSLALIFSGYFSASYSLESSPVILTMMISSLVILKKINQLEKSGIILFVIGCVTSFIDYLTVPLITLGIPIIIYLLKLLKDKKDWKYCINFLIINSIIWFIGYSFTWIFKWVLYDLTINDKNNMLKIGFGQSLFRMQRFNNAMGYDITYGEVILRIFLKSNIYIIISTIILLFLNKFEMIYNKKLKEILPFLIIAIYPIIWFTILANHTIMHEYFVYRNSLLFILALLLSIYILFFEGVKNEKIC